MCNELTEECPGGFVGFVFGHAFRVASDKIEEDSGLVKGSFEGQDLPISALKLSSTRVVGIYCKRCGQQRKFA